MVTNGLSTSSPPSQLASTHERFSKPNVPNELAISPSYVFVNNNSTPIRAIAARIDIVIACIVAPVVGLSAASLDRVDTGLFGWPPSCMSPFSGNNSN